MPQNLIIKKSTFVRLIILYLRVYHVENYVIHHHVVLHDVNFHIHFQTSAVALLKFGNG